MFNSKPAEAPAIVAATDLKRSVIAEDILVDGNIVCQGILEFGGQITGDITADTVVVTSTARVRERVQVQGTPTHHRGRTTRRGFCAKRQYQNWRSCEGKLRLCDT